MKIKTERELVTAINSLNKGSISLKDIEFNHADLTADLKSLTIVFDGEGVDGIISTSMMKSVLALQQHIYQSYADVFYAGNVRSLTETDRKNLELFVRVKNGSAIVEILLTYALTKLADTYFADGKMTDNQQLVTITIILLVIYGGERLYQFAANRRANKKT